MIEEEVLEAIHETQGHADRLSDIADEFRSGRDLNDLMTLLNSRSAELVAIGAWIIGELNFALYNSHQYIRRLTELTDHEAPSVRFHAFGALFPVLDPEDATTLALLEKLRNDTNEGVRKSAEAAAARLSVR